MKDGRDSTADHAQQGLGGGIAGAASIIVVSVVASRLLGFVRQAAINDQFGVSSSADAWFAAFRIPDTIFMLLAGGALLSALIPVLTEVRAREDPAALRAFVRGVAGLVGLCSAVAAGAGVLLAGPLMRAIAPGFDQPTLEAATDAARWLMLSPVLLGLSAVAKGVLQARRRFWPPALSPIVYNLAIIFGAVVLAKTYGLSGLVWGTLIGAGLHLAVQLPALRRAIPSWFGEDAADNNHAAGGRLLVSALGLTNPDVRRVIRLMLPRLAGVAALQLSLVYVNILASLQGESAVAALNNAFLILLLPLGVFAMALGEAALPELSERWARNDRATFARRVSGVGRHVLFLNVPAAVALALLAEPIVAVLFQSGAFDQRATELTAAALRLYAVGLAGHAAVEVLIRGFFAMQDTRTPVVIGAASLALHMLLSWLLAGWIGHAGIALGVSIGVLIEALVMGYVLARRGGLTLAGQELRSAGVVLAAALVMGLVLANLVLMTWSGGGRTASTAGLLVGYLAAGAAAYGAVALLLGSGELEELVGRVAARLRGR